MRPPSKGWYTYDEQIRAELDNLRKALNEARSRGMSEAVNNKYPPLTGNLFSYLYFFKIN